MARSLLDKIDEEFGTTTTQPDEITKGSNLLDKIDAEFGQQAITPVKPVQVVPKPNVTNKATIGPVLKESGKSIGRNILETVRGILGSYDISPKERADLEKIGVTAWKEKITNQCLGCN